ncbi:hypothetical protein BS47DRAFT_661415 [Hydnum rufescens UP504]|uniref:Uncharacterized protein n=1 Tax=Hydnum rufescens UP504 TaxID=1448309 RepID=A0A9P6AF19_9AGAM|nr:hypothetical protein BS47DRAFT_661415 [Hydnum rufescens UP504]
MRNLIVLDPTSVRSDETLNRRWISFVCVDFHILINQAGWANALPLYPVSPIEAGLLPLGVISHSSCALAPFLDWILKSGRW